MANRLSGTYGSMIVNGIPFSVENSTVTWACDSDDVTTTTDNGQQRVVATITRGDGSFTMPVDPANVPSLYPGDYAVNCNFMANDTIGISISNVLITGRTQTQDVTKAITLNFTFRSSGTITQLPAI